MSTASKRDTDFERDLTYEKGLRGKIDSFYGGTDRRILEVGLSCADCPFDKCKKSCKGIWSVGGTLPYDNKEEEDIIKEG
jgi:hypothetical protein